MAAVDRLRSSNPAFRNLQTPSPGQLSEMYGTSERVTTEDVIVHTGGLLILLAAFGGLGWAVTSGGGTPGLALSAGLVALGLSFFISLSRKTRPAAVVVFTAFEGVFVGAISHVYETAYSGIVLQALLGTGVVFLVMLGLHRSGRVRATPRMQRIVLGSLLGVVGLSLLDLVIHGFGGTVPIFDGSGPLSILLTLAILVIASLQFTLDFAYVEAAVAAGAPRSIAWRLAFGLVVSFVWVYLELLRLLGQLRR